MHELAVPETSATCFSLYRPRGISCRPLVHCSGASDNCSSSHCIEATELVKVSMLSNRCMYSRKR